MALNSLFIGLSGIQVHQTRTNVVADGRRLARSWPMDGLRVLWELEAGEGHSGAAVRNGCVYMMDYDRDLHEDIIRCLSLDTGEEIWRYTYYVKVKRNHGMSRTVPAVNDEYVVALGPKCHVHCLDAMTGALFFPLSLVWFIPGFLLLGIYKLRRDDETMSDRTSQFLAVVAIILYQLSKALFMPTIISYVPFSAWVDIPNSMTKVLQVLIPVIILTAGIVAAEIVRRRRPSLSALGYFLIVCGVDAVFTLGVYGVGYLGYL